MLIILLKSSACLVAFMLFYKLCLEKTSAHTFKRFYLIVVIFISIGTPFITFTTYVEPQQLVAADSPQTALNFSEISTFEVRQTKPSQDYLPHVLWSIYSLGVILFSFRFFKNLQLLLKKIKNNPKYKHQSFTHVLLQDFVVPHTFFNYIFINETHFEQNTIPPEILLHEHTHAKQKHSLDILFIEILQIVFWFNPLLYFIKKDIKLNHEFLADKQVLKQGIASSIYQNTLLAFSSNAHSNALANAINYSLIKKRFTVMKTQTSKKIILIRNLFLLPILAILIFAFSDDVYVEKTKNSEETSIKSEHLNKGATESMMKEYNDFITEYENTKRIYHNKLRRAAAIYDIMTEAQRATVTKYPEKFLTTHNPSKVELKHPTQSELDSWMNSTELSITVDALRMENAQLKDYTPSNFVFYRLVSSKRSKNKNTRLVPNKCNLYTSEGYKNIILKQNYNNYHRLFIKYINEIDMSITTNNSGNPELLILKTQLDNIYTNFSKEEIEAFNPHKAPSLPKSNNTTNLKEKKVSKKVIEYNVLAKKYNNPNPKGQRYPRPEIDRLFLIYNQLSKKEKANAEIFPNLPYPVLKTHNERMLKKKHQ